MCGSPSWRRSVTCSDCGLTRSVRKDSSPILCKSCATKRLSRAPRVARPKTGTTAPCEFCGASLYRHVCETRKRFCSKECSDSARRNHPRESRSCITCGAAFSYIPQPKSNSSGRFCSRACYAASMRTGRKRKGVPTRAAVAATRAIHAAIRRGELVRPVCCEQCGKTGRIEAAHFNYTEKLRVRWLCASCHRAWDHAAPKGGSRSVTIAS